MAALFYGINMPFSKLLLNYVPSTILAGLLYLGAGIGMGIMFIFHIKKIDKSELLGKKDFPYVIGMIVLDILAPILLMYGLKNTTSANASLLNNFEIVVTSLVALIVFKEVISPRLWVALAFVSASSVVLSFEDISAFNFSYGSLFVLLAATCWGFENNCTRKISNKNTYEIVMIKGLCCGVGSLIVGFILGERLTEFKWTALSVLLGFVAYGLSIFFYIKAQKNLGAAKTSAYYALAPFIGTFLSLLILGEDLSLQYFIGLGLMAIGSVLATIDVLLMKHDHVHSHTFTYVENGKIYKKTITHSHEHSHFLSEKEHLHYHNIHNELK